jgi:glycosyltransferase involved in cell wall biosynthesis
MSSDADLIDLYRTAALFVFPSLHEGFGLPALEAMACGALVIGADGTSIPEVIGNPEALFDAPPAAIAAGSRARCWRTRPAGERLREHGRVQARKFSWDASAQRAIAALEAHVAARAVARPPPPRLASRRGRAWPSSRRCRPSAPASPTTRCACCPRCCRTSRSS